VIILKKQDIISRNISDEDFFRFNLYGERKEGTTNRASKELKSFPSRPGFSLKLILDSASF